MKHLPGVQAEEDGEEEGRPPEVRGYVPIKYYLQPLAQCAIRTSLAHLLKSMDHSRFLLLTSQLYGSMMSRLYTIRQLGEELTDITTITRYALYPSKFTSDSGFSGLMPLALDLSDVLSSACELANSRASKILAVRSEQHITLTLTEFVEIFKENWEFVLKTEMLAKRMIVSLRGITASQVNSAVSISEKAR